MRAPSGLAAWPGAGYPLLTLRQCEVGALEGPALGAVALAAAAGVAAGRPTAVPTATPRAGAAAVAAHAHQLHAQAVLPLQQDSPVKNQIPEQLNPEPRMK